MRHLLALTVSLALGIATVLPAAATVVDNDKRGLTQDLNERVRPLLEDISSITDKLPGGVFDTVDWEIIQEAASQGLDETMTTRVHECSKDYWAMTYATFGLFYLASTRAMDMGDTEQARAELSTAVTTTNLSQAAYLRALRDCEPGLGSDLGSAISGSAIERMV